MSMHIYYIVLFELCDMVKIKYSIIVSLILTLITMGQSVHLGI